MLIAHFAVNGAERETREVEDRWLLDTWSNRDYVLLTDGNTYQLTDVHFVAEGNQVHVPINFVAPRFARGG